MARHFCCAVFANEAMKYKGLVDPKTSHSATCYLCRIYPPSQFPWNRHSKVRGIFVFKQLQKFFFCYGKLTISSLLRYSSLFHKEQTTVVRVVTGPLKGCCRRYCLKAIVRVRTIVLLFLGLGLKC